MDFFFYDNVARRFILLRDGMVFGRTVGDVTFPDDDVMSYQHCRLSIGKQEVQIEDLKSTNKTRVNSVKMAPGSRRRLQLDDVVEFGARRFILTNQDRYVPAHSEEELSSLGGVKAGRTLGGSLTGRLTRAIREQTKVIVTRRELAGQKLEKFSSPRRWDATTFVMAGFLAVYWVVWQYSFSTEGAFAGELLHDTGALAVKFFLVSGATTLGATLGHYLVANVLARRSWIRWALLPVSLLAAWGMCSALDAMAGLSSDAQENISVRHCVVRFDRVSCLRYGNEQYAGFRTLPKHVQETIRANLAQPPR